VHDNIIEILLRADEFYTVLCEKYYKDEKIKKLENKLLVQVDDEGDVWDFGNRTLEYGYKEGFEDAIRFVLELTPEKEKSQLLEKQLTRVEK